jgi:Cys-rich repeat protein
VQCLTSNNCTGGLGAGNVCEPTSQRCVECVTDTDCGPGGVCDTATHTCL